MENKEIEFAVPSNVSARYEFFYGFGWKELIIVAVALLIGILIFSVLGIPKKIEYLDPKELMFTENTVLNEDGLCEIKIPIVPMLARVFIIVVSVSSTFFSIKKDPLTDESFWQLYKRKRKFQKEQQKYSYVYNSGSGEFEN